MRRSSMRSLTLLSLTLLSVNTFASEYDLPCDAEYCVIPYGVDGNANGTERCYADETKTKIIRELNWKDGKREGMVKCWKPDGKLKFEAEYKNDTLNGPYVEHDYDSTGAKVVLLENGKEIGLGFRVKDGKVTRADYCMIDGVKAFEAALSCKDRDYGKYTPMVAAWKKEELAKNKKAAAAEAKRLNGPQESKFSSGQTRAKWTNKNGEIHGKFLGYFETGKVKTDCEYSNGKHEGPCLEYDQEGRLDKREMWSADKLTKAETFYDNGKPKEVITYGEKGRSCVVEYYDNGNKSVSVCYIERTNYGYYYYYSWRSQTPDGEYLSWDETGAPSEKGLYTDGKRTGKWESFYEGQIDREYFYDKGNLQKTIDYERKAPQHRIVREYMPDGSLKLEKKLEGLTGDKEKLI